MQLEVDVHQGGDDGWSGLVTLVGWVSAGPARERASGARTGILAFGRLDQDIEIKSVMDQHP